MTDMRRTLLWVVFTMSLVLLWDAWNKHTGQPSMFGGPARPTASAGAGPDSTPLTAPGAAGGNAIPAPVASAVPPPSAAAALPSPTPTPTPAGSEKITLTTDVVRATFDSVGGTLVQLELLKQRDQNEPNKPVVLFDQNPKRLYLAQTGLITEPAGRDAADPPDADDAPASASAR